LREHVCHKSLAVSEANATSVDGEVGVANLWNPQLRREQRRSECVIRKMAGSVYNTRNACSSSASGNSRGSRQTTKVNLIAGKNSACGNAEATSFSELQTVSETLEAALRYNNNEATESAVGECQTPKAHLTGNELPFVLLIAEPNTNLL
jgi:hypothetical protein